MILNLILLQLIIIFLIDISGGIQSVKKFIWRHLKEGKPYQDFPFKPFECSLCMTFWTGLFYLLFTGSFSLPYIAFVCLLAFMSSSIKSLILTVKDLIDKFINKLDR
jgi:hypothetical protein